MNLSTQQTAEAYWLLYQTLPEDVQAVIKNRIARTTKAKPQVDLQRLASAGWDDKKQSYSRDELYD